MMKDHTALDTRDDYSGKSQFSYCQKPTLLRNNEKHIETSMSAQILIFGTPEMTSPSTKNITTVLVDHKKMHADV